ncbi:MAG: SPFH domain-containing protein [Myxococcaceae bacterium]
MLVFVSTSLSAHHPGDSGVGAVRPLPPAEAGQRGAGLPHRRRKQPLSGVARLLLAFGGFACATVPPGHGAVVLAPSGVQPAALGEGVSPIPWFGEVSLYDLREQELTVRFEAITRDGSPAATSASVVTFRIVPDELVGLAREVGPLYASVLVRPEVEAAVRFVIGGLKADELDTDHIVAAQSEVTLRAAERLRPYHVLLESVDLRTLRIESPLALGQVGATLVLEQRLQGEPRELEIAQKLAEARREEAAGLADRHEAVRSSLSPQSLEDFRRRVWDELLRAPSATIYVEAAGSPAIVEVSP